jgi:D-aspartate ligase
MSTLYATKRQERTESVHAVSPVCVSTPPVLILNMFYTGLGIARDMAGKGVRVIGLSADHQIYGNFTRCCEVRMAPNSQEEPEQLFDMLVRLSSEVDGAVIFPTRDADVLFLDRFRNELTHHYTLAIPPHECLMQAMNKHALAVAAQRAGVPVPKTMRISSSEDLHKLESEVGFPCVLKPVFAASWRGAESWKKVGARKAIRIDNLQQLEHEYELLSWVDREVLAQEWIPGASDQIVVLGGYVGREGNLTQYFTARKLVQSPNDFGTGCVVESEEIPEIVALSKRLCKSLRYEGMAEIEYKYDKATGKFKLIEINTRHWDWHRLGAASSINLSWTAYCDLTGQPIDRQTKPTSRAKWIAEDALFTYLLRALYRGKLNLGDLWRKLSGHRVYGVFAWSDPRPGVRYCFSEFLPNLAKAIFQSVRGGRLS